MSSIIEIVQRAIDGGVNAIRITATLESATGGPKILPPTYAEAEHGHNMVKPGADGVSPWVSVDSPASFANRMEEALVRCGLNLDPVRVRIGNRTVSTMQLPHRCFDAVLRDSELEDTPWRKTEIGKSLVASTPQSAEAMLRYDPSVLLFGAWDSTELGKTGGIGHRWPAIFSGEISATDVVPLRRAGNRIDPLGIEGTDASLVENEDGTLRPADQDGDAELPVLSDRNRDKYPRRIKPSQANHGNTLSLIEKGVLVRGDILLHGALSLSALRRYGFGAIDHGAGQLLIALMALYAAAAVLEDGLALRRDCVLVPRTASWQLLRPGQASDLDIGAEAALEGLTAALHKVPVADPIELTPSRTLEHLVARYR